MRRIALFSDIHGNSVALDAVLTDIDSAGIAERYCLGDLIGYGPDPAGVIERVRASGIPTIQGNYDEGVASRRGECGCYYATDTARADGAESYRVTDRMLSPSDAEWLLSLPLQVWLDAADGPVSDSGAPRILLTHGSPRKINEYLLLDRTEAQLTRLAQAAGADVVCHGHIHIPYHRSFAAPAEGSGSGAGESASPAPLPAPRIHYVSSGSVGKPKDGDPRACWVELLIGSQDEIATAMAGEPAIADAATVDAAAAAVGEAGGPWLAAVPHRVDYDIDAVARAMAALGTPMRLIEALRTA